MTATLTLLIDGTETWTGPLTRPQGDGQWHDKAAGDEPYKEFAASGDIHVGVYAAHQWGGTHGDPPGWGLHNIPGTVFVCGNFGGPNQVNLDGFERVKRVIDQAKSEWGITKFVLAGLSGGGRLVGGVLGSYPGIAQGAVSQLGIYDLAAWYGECMARGDIGDANIIAAACGGAPEGETMPAYLARSPKGFVANVRDCIVHIDGAEGDNVVPVHHQTEFHAALQALPGAANVVSSLRIRSGGHVPDYPWIKARIEEVIAAIS